MSEQKPARYDAFINKAERLVRSPARLQRLAGQATRKLAAQGEDGLREAQDQFETALALVKAWASGEYRDVHTRTIVAVVAALLYFVVPMDVIPDFLLGWGFIDDIAVISYVFAQLKEEINAFRAWQTASEDPDDEPS